MKKESGITSLLGLNQKDIAMLLGVSRSQWAMYETGKRTLPSAATQILATLLVQVQAPQILEKRVMEVDQPEKRYLQIEHMLRENDYKQMVVAKKIIAARKKQERTARMLQLSEFLNSQSVEIAQNIPVQTISRKTSKALDADYSAELIKLELKQSVLEVEKLFLIGKLRKYTETPVNSDAELTYMIRSK